ncbi:hypothetical protein M6B38_268345 [Iris pallida]|uniref:Uncharacterized protein n=1 Tax=Iris pallida TaxID=29817 RepID=A0AAX6I8Z7_IRIPA|nr:hypothetical protein M6B38_268345 [Iris pallida]
MPGIWRIASKEFRYAIVSGSDTDAHVIMFDYRSIFVQVRPCPVRWCPDSWGCIFIPVRTYPSQDRVVENLWVACVK